MAADLTGQDVSIVVNQRWISGVKRHARGTLVVTDAALEYTTGGLNLAKTTPAIPVYKRFGMDRQLDVVLFQAQLTDLVPGTSSITSYNIAYNPLTKLFVVSISDDADLDDELANTVAVGAKTVTWYAIGW